MIWNYTFGHIPRIDEIATHACEPGSWDTSSAPSTEDEVSQLLERNKDALERAGRDL